MKVSDMAARTPLSGCAQTEIQNELLEAIVTNRWRVEKYRSITPITATGHLQHSASRQILSYLARVGLGITRRPGYHDIKLLSQAFCDISNAELDAAAADVARIYEHTQAQISPLMKSVQLVRGVDGIEAAVCAKLLEETEDETIDIYFQTVAFFNHVCGPFSRQINMTIDCPSSWIWASAYTLRDLELPGQDEEFIVVCRSPDGMMEVPRANFEYTSSFHPIDRVVEPRGLPRGFAGRKFHPAISALMLEGFEPDDYDRPIACYTPGRWEDRLASIGRWLDMRRAELFRNRIIFRRKASH